MRLDYTEEQRRLQEIRQIVLATTNNTPIRVGDVVDGGPQNTSLDPSRPVRLDPVQIMVVRPGPAEVLALCVDAVRA